MGTIQDKDIRGIIQTYVEGSYLPAVILNADQSSLVEYYLNKEGLENDRLFRSLSQEVQRWISTSLCTGVYYNSASQVPSGILDRVWDFLSDIIFPGKQLRRLKNDACEYIATAEKEFNGYVTAHEELLNKVRCQIDIINERKSLMKDDVLRMVAARLSSMGIKSEVAGYPRETLDIRKFGLNEEFNDIRKAFREIQDSAYTKFLEHLPEGSFGYLPVANFLVYLRARQLKDQIQNIKTLTVPVFEKMRSDNQKVKCLHKALKNIAEIYTDITARFIPAIRKILDLIETKYHDKLCEIPDDVLCLLRSVTRIMKSLSEKCILPEAERDQLIDATISTANNMSVEYEKLRQTMASAA